MRGWRFRLELGGPFEIPLPPLGTKRLLLGLGGFVLLTALLGGGVYFFALRSPLAQARDAMRMARYDTALEALDTVPAWLRNWPALAALRVTAGWVPGLTNLRRIGSPSARICGGSAPTGRPMLT